MLKPITHTRQGEQIAIKCLGCSCEDACQLQKMGCFEGANGTVLSNCSRVVVQIGDTRLALSENLAKTILVSSA